MNAISLKVSIVILCTMFFYPVVHAMEFSINQSDNSEINTSDEFRNFVDFTQELESDLFEYFAENFLIDKPCHKDYTQSILNIITKYVPNNPIILEVGAHFGEDTKKMCLFWPQGFVHVFEPSPYNMSRVQKNIQGLDNVKTYPIALSDFVGTAPFYINPSNPGSDSLFVPITYSHNYSAKPIMVNCVTLDHWAEQNKIDHIDFIWLDVEGAELNVLKAGINIAGINILRTVKVIHTEVNFKEFWYGIALFKELKEWLEEKNFKIIWRSTQKETFQANIVFVNSECIDVIDS